MPSRSGDVIFSVLVVALQKIEKHLRIISQWRLRHVIENKIFSLEKYRNRFNLHIMETLRKKLFLPEDLAFYHFNLRLIPKIAAKFAKPARSEVRFLEFKR